MLTFLESVGRRSEAEFYARFSSKRRHALRREQAAPEQQGIQIRTVRGTEIAKDPSLAVSSGKVDDRRTVWKRSFRATRR